jgi:hypothetical protein
MPKTPTGARSDSPPQSPTQDQLDRTLEAALQQADDERAQAFTELQLVRGARVQALQRQEASLRAQGDPRAADLAAVLDANRLLARRLNADAARAATPSPPPNPQRWILHGHVLNQQLEPVQGAEAYLVDASGKRVRGSTSSTDQAGHFVLEAAPPVPGGETEEGAVYFRVARGRSQVLYEEAAPIRPVASGVEYMEVVLAEESPQQAEPGARARQRSTTRATSPPGTRRTSPGSSRR